jgi:FixJ family two-component response regulator
MKTLEEEYPTITRGTLSGVEDPLHVRVHATDNVDGAINFLQKPFTPHALLQRIRQVLDSQPGL